MTKAGYRHAVYENLAGIWMIQKPQLIKEGGFARTAPPGDHDEPVAGQFQIDILEVVFPGAPDNDLMDGHR